MSEDDREHPLVDAIELENTVVAGDPDEALPVYEARIEELEEALEVIDEEDPQYDAVRFELGMLRKGCEAIREQHDVDDQEGES
jgi:hypothetical protein